MNTPDPLEWHRLFSAALDDRLSEDEARQLQDLLKSSADARRLWFVYQDNECDLAELKSPSVAAATPVRRSRLSPLIGMAAGVLVGMVFAQALHSAADARQVRTVLSFSDGFEAGPAPRVTGLPSGVDVWSGDYTEPVPAPAGLRAERGERVLRLLRADYEGKPRAEGSYTGDVYRLVDLRPHRAALADGRAVLQASAGFNALPFPATERYGAAIAVYALGQERIPTPAELAEAIGPAGTSLAMAQKRSRALDADPATWERLEVELRLPPETDFVLLRLAVVHATPQQRRETFDGQFLDEVRLSVTRREALR